MASSPEFTFFAGDWGKLVDLLPAKGAFDVLLTSDSIYSVTSQVPLCCCRCSCRVRFSGGARSSCALLRALSRAVLSCSAASTSCAHTKLSRKAGRGGAGALFPPTSSAYTFRIMEQCTRGRDGQPTSLCVSPTFDAHAPRAGGGQNVLFWCRGWHARLRVSGERKAPALAEHMSHRLDFLGINSMRLTFFEPTPCRVHIGAAVQCNAAGGCARGHDRAHCRPAERRRVQPPRDPGDQVDEGRVIMTSYGATRRERGGLMIWRQ